MRAKHWVLLGTALAGLTAAWLINRWSDLEGYTLPPPDGKQIMAGQTPAVLEPKAAADPNPRGPVRLAIGGLGLADPQQDGQVADLVLAELTADGTFELVDRRSLQSVLRETEFSLSGLLQPTNAVKVGRLLRVDWFLTGSAALINGTNSILIRLILARSGMIRDLALLSCREVEPTSLAHDLAAFASRSAHTSATAEQQVFLAIGGFQDLSINNRHASFPEELRARLTTAYQGSQVTVLERELVTPLLQEVRLALGGLSEDTGPLPDMQAAFWLVDGLYQSYETAGPEIDLVLRIQRIRGARRVVPLRGAPGETLFAQVKKTVDESMADRAIWTLPLGRKGEVQAQMRRGMELSRLKITYHDGKLVTPMTFFSGRQGPNPEREKWRRNLEEAIRAFETVLLLDPDNLEARMLLAACLQDWEIGRSEEARNYYREIMSMAKDRAWANTGRYALAFSYDYYSKNPRKAVDLIREWEREANDPELMALCRQILSSAIEELCKKGEISIEEALPYAEASLMSQLQGVEEMARSKGVLNLFNFNDVLHVCRFNPARTVQEVNRILPKLEERCPTIRAYLLVHAVEYQVDTNSPVVSRFRGFLEECAQDPEKALPLKETYGNVLLMPSLWGVSHGAFDITVRIAEIQAARGRELSDQDKVILAFAYRGLGNWKEALAVFEGFGNRAVTFSYPGPWGDGGTTFLCAKAAEECRSRLGLLPARSAADAFFDAGKPVLTLRSRFVFAPEDDEVWVAWDATLARVNSGGKILSQLALIEGSAGRVTCILNSENHVWLGTGGSGLIDYDKTGRKAARLTMRDGLLLDHITALDRLGDQLWIGFGEGEGGGLGVLDLKTGKLKTLMSPLPARLSDVPDRPAGRQLVPWGGPPRQKVAGIAHSSPDDLWVAVWRRGLQHYSLTRNRWQLFRASDVDNSLSCLVADSELVAAGCQLAGAWAAPGGQDPLRGGLSLLPAPFGEVIKLYTRDGLPNDEITALALAKPNLWIGGRGFLAVMNLETRQVGKTCQISSAPVDQIEVAGDSAWVGVDKKLFRIPLNQGQ